MKLSNTGKALIGTSFVAAGAVAGVRIANANGKNPVVGGLIGGGTGAVVAFGMNLGYKKFKSNAAKKAAKKVADSEVKSESETTKTTTVKTESKESFDASHIDMMKQMPGETASAFKARMQKIIDQADEALHTVDSKKSDVTEKKAS